MSETLTPRISAPEAVPAAVRSTYLAFIGAGFGFATWASRIPQVRDRLHLDPARLGLLLLAIAVGSIVALPLAGVIVHHFGSRHTVAAMAILLAAGLGAVALGYLVGVVPVVIGLLLLGFANGAWDVAMNVQGATAERLLGRAIMPRFHAGYSIGTVTGALSGAAMVATHVPVTVHFLATAMLLAVLVPVAVRGFAPDDDDRSAHEPADGATSGQPAQASAHRAAFGRWREPRTLLVGVFVLSFAFAEGTGNDWLSVSLIDGHHTSAAVGTLGFSIFLAAMTLGRWFGPPVLDRFGRVTVVRALAVVTITGLVLYVFSAAVWLAFAGALLWGVGASLGFPVGMSAAADEPAAAAGRVSVVASIGYCAFLAGPPVIGLLAQHTSVLHALTAAAVLLGLAASLAGALRPPTAALPDS